MDYLIIPKVVLCLPLLFLLKGDDKALKKAFTFSPTQRGVWNVFRAYLSNHPKIDGNNSKRIENIFQMPRLSTRGDTLNILWKSASMRPIYGPYAVSYRIHSEKAESKRQQTATKVAKKGKAKKLF